MNQLLAVCQNDKCGFIFPVTGLLGGNGRVDLRINNVRTFCPKCDSIALMLDGQYDYSNEVLRFVNGPAQSLETLRRVNILLEEAKENETTKEQVLQAVEKESPEIAGLFRSITSKIGNIDYKFWLPFLLSILAIIISHKDAAKPDDSDVSKALIHHLQQENEELKRNQEHHTQPTSVITAKTAVQANRQGRNKPCKCGSGEKQRNCCKPY